MSAIRIEYDRAWDAGSAPVREILIYGYPGPIGEAEIYAIKTALEKQVKLNAEVQRLKDRRKVDITAAH